MKSYKPNQATILYLNSSFNCIKSSSITLTVTSGGSGYTSAPSIAINTASGDTGYGASATCAITSGAVSSITMVSTGFNYNKLPTIVLTGGGSTTAAVITPSFLKTYNYNWGIPDVVINDLGRISAINLVATGFSTSTPYTFRIKELQTDSRNSFYSDYGDPIISMVRNTNIANNDALGGESVIVLSSQTIRQIQLTVSDSLTTLNNGISSSINFIIALKIEEFDPTYTEIGDVYGESASRLKTML